MIEIELTSNELREDVYLKLNKDRNAPIYDEDLDTIKSINLNGLDFLDEPTDVSIFDLVFFKKLESCAIINKEILDKELEVLNEVTSLRSLQITNCILPKNKQLKLNLEYITIDKCSDVDIHMFNDIKSLQQLRIVNCNNVILDGISNLENLTDLYLQNLNMDNINEITRLKKLEYLNLNGTKVNGSTDFKHNKKLKVVHEEANFLYDEEW